MDWHELGDIDWPDFPFVHLVIALERLIKAFYADSAIGLRREQ